MQALPPIQFTPIPSQSNPTPFFTRMETPTDVPAFPQGQQGSSSLPLGPHSSQVISKVSEDGELRYYCSICNADYAQRQGTWRHLRTAHYPKEQCSRCNFEWVRPYDCRHHFEKEHPGVEPDVGKAPRRRRKATIPTEHLPQQPPVSLPAIDQLQQNSTESQPNPSALPSPTVFLSAVSFLNDNSQPTELMNDMGNYVQDAQFGSITGSTATHSSSNPGTAPIPTLFFPSVGVSYGAFVPEDPMVEPPGSSYDADEDIELTVDLLVRTLFSGDRPDPNIDPTALGSEGYGLTYKKGVSCENFPRIIAPRAPSRTAPNPNFGPS